MEYKREPTQVIDRSKCRHGSENVYRMFCVPTRSSRGPYRTGLERERGTNDLWSKAHAQCAARISHRWLSPMVQQSLPTVDVGELAPTFSFFLCAKCAVLQRSHGALVCIGEALALCILMVLVASPQSSCAISLGPGG